MTTAVRVVSPETDPEMRILNQVFSQESAPRGNRKGLRAAGKAKDVKQGVVSGKVLPRTVGT